MTQLLSKNDLEARVAKLRAAIKKNAVLKHIAGLRLYVAHRNLQDDPNSYEYVVVELVRSRVSGVSRSSRTILLEASNMSAGSDWGASFLEREVVAYLVGQIGSSYGKAKV